MPKDILEDIKSSIGSSSTPAKVNATPTPAPSGKGGILGEIGQSIRASSGVEDDTSQYAGLKYRWGAKPSSGSNYSDCSGFVQHYLGIKGMSLPRTAIGQYRATQRIGMEDLQPNDLVFMDTGAGNTGNATAIGKGKHVTHVGVYLGNGLVAEMGSKGFKHVKLADRQNIVVGYGRTPGMSAGESIINDLTNSGEYGRYVKLQSAGAKRPSVYRPEMAPDAITESVLAKWKVNIADVRDAIAKGDNWRIPTATGGFVFKSTLLKDIAQRGGSPIIALGTRTFAPDDSMDMEQAYLTNYGKLPEPQTYRASAFNPDNLTKGRGFAQMALDFGRMVSYDWAKNVYGYSDAELKALEEEEKSPDASVLKKIRDFATSFSFAVPGAMVDQAARVVNAKNPGKQVIDELDAMVKGIDVMNVTGGGLTREYVDSGEAPSRMMGLFMTLMGTKDAAAHGGSPTFKSAMGIVDEWVKNEGARIAQTIDSTRLPGGPLSGEPLLPRKGSLYGQSLPKNILSDLTRKALDVTDSLEGELNVGPTVPDGPVTHGGVKIVTGRKASSTLQRESISPDLISEIESGSLQNGTIVGTGKIKSNPSAKQASDTVLMLVEADDVKASHHEMTFEENADYTQSLQQRSRTSAGNKQAVMDQAQNLDPNQLQDAYLAGTGAPVVGVDGFVDAGNGRVMAIKRASKVHPERYQEYVDHLRDTYGEVVDEYHRPILVRVRRAANAADRESWAAEANQTVGAAPTKIEKATINAGQLDTLDMAGWQEGEGKAPESIARQFNKGPLNKLREKLGTSATQDWLAPDGTLSQTGVDNVLKIILAKVFGSDDEAMMTAFGGVRGATKAGAAISDSAIHLLNLKLDAETGALPAEANPTGVLSHALRLITESRRLVDEGKFKTIPEALKQGNMFEEGTVEQVAGRMLAEELAGLKSSKTGETFITDIADRIRSAGAGQDDLFAGDFKGETSFAKAVIEAIDGKPFKESEYKISAPTPTKEVPNAKQEGMQPEKGRTEGQIGSQMSFPETGDKTGQYGIFEGEGVAEAPKKSSSKPSPEKPSQARPDTSLFEEPADQSSMSFDEPAPKPSLKERGKTRADNAKTALADLIKQGPPSGTTAGAGLGSVGEQAAWAAKVLDHASDMVIGYVEQGIGTVSEMVARAISEIKELGHDVDQKDLERAVAAKLAKSGKDGVARSFKDSEGNVVSLTQEAADEMMIDAGLRDGPYATDKQKALDWVQEAYENGYVKNAEQVVEAGIKSGKGLKPSETIAVGIRLKEMIEEIRSFKGSEEALALKIDKLESFYNKVQELRSQAGRQLFAHRLMLNMDGDPELVGLRQKRVMKRAHDEDPSNVDPESEEGKLLIKQAKEWAKQAQEAQAKVDELLKESNALRDLLEKQTKSASIRKKAASINPTDREFSVAVKTLKAQLAGPMVLVGAGVSIDLRAVSIVARRAIANGMETVADIVAWIEKNHGVSVPASAIEESGVLKRELTPEERAAKYIKKRIEDIDKRIAEIEGRSTADEPAKASEPKPTSPELEAKRDELARARRVASLKQAIADLEKKRRTKDYATKPKADETDAEIIALKEKLDNERKWYRREKRYSELEAERKQLEEMVNSGDYSNYKPIVKKMREAADQQLLDMASRNRALREAIEAQIRISSNPIKAFLPRLDATISGLQVANVVNRVYDMGGNVWNFATMLTDSHPIASIEKLFFPSATERNIAGIGPADLKAAYKGFLKRIVVEQIRLLKGENVENMVKYGGRAQGYLGTEYLRRLAGTTDLPVFDPAQRAMFNALRNKFHDMPTETVLQYARNWAEEVVYMNDTLFSKLLDFRGVDSGTKQAILFSTNIVARFPRVIAAVMGKTTDHVYGLGIVKGGFQWASKALTGAEWTAADRALFAGRLWRGSKGIALMYLGYKLAENGWLEAPDKEQYGRPAWHRFLANAPGGAQALMLGMTIYKHNKGKSFAKAVQSNEAVAAGADQLTSHPFFGAMKDLQTVLQSKDSGIGSKAYEVSVKYGYRNGVPSQLRELLRADHLGAGTWVSKELQKVLLSKNKRKLARRVVLGK